MSRKDKKRQKKLLQQQAALGGPAEGAASAGEGDEDEDEVSPAPSSAADPPAVPPASGPPAAEPPASAAPAESSPPAAPPAPEPVGTPVPASPAATETKEPRDWPRTLAAFLDEQLPLTKGYVVALIVAVVFCVYANSMRVPFLFDDAPVITRNRLFHELSFANAEKIAQNHPLRAIPNLTFYLNYHMQGTPAYQYSTGDYAGTYGPNYIYHIFNMALHAVNGIFLFLLLRALLAGAASARPLRAAVGRQKAQKKGQDVAQAIEDPVAPLADWIALAATLFWLVHPIQTMAVTYIAQRYALFAALGTFGSLWCYVTLRRRMESGFAWLPQNAIVSWLYFAGTLLLWLVGCFSKENSAIVPFLIPAIEWLCFSRTVPQGNQSILDDVVGERNGRWLLSVMLIPFVFLAVLGRYHMAGTLEDLIPASAPTFPDRMSYFRTEWVCLLKYLRLFALPTDLTVEQAFPCLVWSEPGHAFEMIKALLCHGLIVALAVVWYRSGRKFLTFCVIWYYMTNAIESSFLPILDPMVEHRMYIPSAFLAAAFAYVVARGAASVWLYGADWTRSFAERFAGERAQVEEKTANALEAVRAPIFERRHEIGAGFVAGWCLLIVSFGFGTFMRNKAWGAPGEESDRIWRDTVEKRPDCARAYSSLGMEKLYNGKWTEAIEPIEAALYLGPYHVEGWNNIGKAYLELGSSSTLFPLTFNQDPRKSALSPCPLLEWAEETLMRGIEVNEVAASPSVPLCWNNLGLTYMKMAERLPKDAAGPRYENQVRVLEMRFQLLLRGLSHPKTFTPRTDHPLAVRIEALAAEALTAATEIDPGYETAWINLGTCYYRSCEKTPRGHDQYVLAKKSVAALKSSGAARSRYHQLFNIAATNIALADKAAEHHAEAFLYLDEMYLRASEDLAAAQAQGNQNLVKEAEAQIVSVLGMYAEEGVNACNELVDLVEPLERQQQELTIIHDPVERKNLEESIADVQGELNLARQLRAARRFSQAGEALARQAEVVQKDPRAFARYARSAARLLWFGGEAAERAHAFQLYDSAIAATPAGEEHDRLVREKQVLEGAPPPK